MPAKINDGLTAAQRWYRKNKARALAYNKQWRQKNLEYARSLSIKWNQEHKEKIREINRAYYQRHKERKAAEKRAWRAANPEKEKEIKRRWYKNNPAVARAQTLRKKLRRRKLEAGSIDGAVLAKLVQSHKGKCYWCRKPYGKFQVDHVMPLSLGGANNGGNIVLACATCNLTKRAKTPMEWAGRLL